MNRTLGQTAGQLVGDVTADVTDGTWEGESPPTIPNNTGPGTHFSLPILNTEHEQWAQIANTGRAQTANYTTKHWRRGHEQTGWGGMRIS